MLISDDIRYIGVDDHAISLFEGQYSVPNGMSYNSYVILDEKTAVMDTVDKGFTDEWLSKLEDALEGKAPDYLVVHHMEPDHSANIAVFMEKYPHAVVVSSQKAFAMMKNFFGTDYPDRRIAVGENDSLPLGKHTLTFITAPMVHWPEVIMSYDSLDKVLFSADAFGKFGALDAPEEWDPEARRYYYGIVGKFGMPVSGVLKKAAKLDISMICPLHGPVLSDDLSHYMELYSKWAAYEPENEGVLIAYTSVYGNTKKAAVMLKDKLAAKGCDVRIIDLARGDMCYALASAFEYKKLVCASTTYNGGVFPFMREFITDLSEHGYKNRQVFLIENGSWAPTAAGVMKKLFEGCKDIVISDSIVKISSAVSAENEAQIEALAEEISAL
ncbi:MAG: FprA family A-type flavoprotein [Oscillospiraceae bacterium]|nr:FprA family A-type flavoprotein [Oscillospiraceae bacterium]